MALPVHTLSVRGLLMLLTCLLGALALTLASINLKQALDSHRTAHFIATHNHIATLCIAAVKDFAFERGRTNVILNSREKISSYNRGFINDRRIRADRAITSILAARTEMENGDFEEVARAWETVKNLRDEVDRDFDLPPQGRDPALRDRWFAAASELNARIEALLIKATRAPVDDTTFDRLSAVRINALQLRNITGAESSRIGSAVAANHAPTPEALMEIYRLRGRTEQLWIQLERGALLIDDPEFTKAMGRVRNEFLERLRPLQNDLLRALAVGQSTQLDIEAYSKIAVTFLDSIIEALNSIDKATSNYTEQKLLSAHRHMFLNIAAIAAAIALVGMSILVTGRRISRPLRGIVGRIDAIMHRGESAVSDPAGDEFSKVARALDMLDASIKEREHDAEALKQANLKLVALSVTDELTGLANRRHLNEALSQEWARARRNEQPIAVLMADIDFFKKYNDFYGHQAGDDCLVDVARVLREGARRPGDIVARYGGEEFVMISPATTLAQAKLHADTLCRAVENLALPHVSSPHGQVTISIGVAALVPRGSIRAEDLLRMADAALYRAKANGRNRSEVMEQ